MWIKCQIVRIPARCVFYLIPSCFIHPCMTLIYLFDLWFSFIYVEYIVFMFIMPVHLFSFWCNLCRYRRLHLCHYLGDWGGQRDCTRTEWVDSRWCCIVTWIREFVLGRLFRGGCSMESSGGLCDEFYFGIVYKTPFFYAINLKTFGL